MIRGVIAPASIFEVINGDSITGRIISAEELRYFILYWDRVVIPTSNIIHSVIPDEGVLVDSGVVTRPNADSGTISNFNSGAFPEMMRKGHARIAENLILTEPDIDWVMHQVGRDWIIPDGFRAESRTVRIALQKALPMPGEAVPMAEILDFKERRQAELAALHDHLDAMYMDVLGSPDPDLSRRKSVARLKESIADLDVVSKERWKVTSKVDFSVDLNLDASKILTSAAAAAAFETYVNLGLSIPLTAVAGGLISLMKLTAKKSITFEPAMHNLKLGYLMSAKEEQILPQASKSELRGRQPVDIFAHARRKLAEIMWRND